MVPSTQPRVYLVGAGPGDPELLTLRALKVLQSARVVLFDALIGEGILDYAPVDALRVFVGKRAGKHRVPQSEIQEMLVYYAQKFGQVVRLKGGDPFVFGRGYEEQSYLESHHIQVEVVPGISSALAVPTAAQVPLTSRGISHGFWVVTGTTSSGELAHDVQLAARSTATVVVLMGMRKIREITRLFAKVGKADCPAMVVINGTLPGQQCIKGKVRDLAEAVVAEAPEGPGIIVIGEVVGLAPSQATQHIFSQILATS